MKKLEAPGAGLVSTLPLFYAASGLLQAAALGASVIACLFIFELLFALVRRFSFRSLRPLFALVVFGCVLEASFLAGQLFFQEEEAAQLSSGFPLALVSTFLLAQGEPAVRTPLRKRLAACGFFLVFLFVLGFSRQWNGPFQTFLAGPFWLSGSALAVFGWFKQKAGA